MIIKPHFVTGKDLDIPLEDVDIPITKRPPKWKRILKLFVPGPIHQGEIWDIYYEFHCTSEQPYNVALVDQGFIQLADTGNEREGQPVNDDTGAANITPEGHHCLRQRQGFWQPQDDYPNGAWLKVLGHAKATQAKRGDRLDITADRGMIKILRFCEK